MAIDDNTSYELTGAQVKDLAQRIKAGGGGGVLIGYINYTAGTVPSGSISVYTDTTYTTAISADDVAAALDNGDTVFFRFTDGWDEIKILSIADSEAMIGDDTIVYHFMASSSKDCIGQLQGHVDDWGVAFFLNSLKSVNNGTLTVQHNGTTVQTFSANQSSSATANVETIYADPIQSIAGITPPIQTSMIADGAITSAKLSTTDLIPEVVNTTTYQTAWKFPDGKLICFGGKYNAYDITSGYEGDYFASTGSNLTSIFAVPFIDTPQVTVTLQYNSGLLGFNLTSTTTNGFAGYIWKSQSKSSVGITVRYIAIGKWK